MEYEQVNGEIYITKGNQNGAIIEIPKEIDGLKVTGIGAYAFSGNNELQRISLPEGIRVICGHAFYNCRNLKTVELWDGIEEMFDGAFKNCHALRKVEMTSTGHREGCVRNLLSDNIQEITLRIHYDDGESRLLFPTFEDDYVENTPARIFQSVSFGSGSAYRRCMQSNTIDYEVFDSLFDKSVREDRFEAPVNNALNRLVFPYELKEKYAKAYSSFLSENDTQVMLMFLQYNNTVGIDYMCRNKLIGKDAITTAITKAGELSQVAILGRLMEYKTKNFPVSNEEKFKL